MSDRGINVTVESNANHLILHLDALPAEIRAALKAKIGELTGALLLEVKAAEPHRTGHLRSMTRAFVDEGETWVRGRVRVLQSDTQNTAAAAGALEYGAHRMFPVRAHRAHLTHVFGRATSQSVMVSTYWRRANIREMRFLRGPAAAARPAARAQLEAIINQTLAKAQDKL
jgi:hypothetical protein